MVCTTNVQWRYYGFLRWRAGPVARRRRKNIWTFLFLAICDLLLGRENMDLCCNVFYVHLSCFICKHFGFEYNLDVGNTRVCEWIIVNFDFDYSWIFFVGSSIGYRYWYIGPNYVNLEYSFIVSCLFIWCFHIDLIWKIPVNFQIVNYHNIEELSKL